jgi:hypothetical protein
MSGSSRSIAAARQRRSGEKQPTFSQQQPSKNFQQQQQPQPQKQFQNRVVSQQQPKSVEPQRPKLSVSDAFGLVTLRLGKVEQFIQQISDNGDLKPDLLSNHNSNSSIPENSQIIDKSVFANMISRLDSLEKKDNASITRQINSLEAELRSTKELLNSLTSKFDNFAKETNDKFGDFEVAIEEIEKNITFVPSQGEEATNQPNDLFISDDEIEESEENIGITFSVQDN